MEGREEERELRQVVKAAEVGVERLVREPSLTAKWKTGVTERCDGLAATRKDTTASAVSQRKMPARR